MATCILILGGGNWRDARREPPSSCAFAPDVWNGFAHRLRGPGMIDLRLTTSEPLDGVVDDVVDDATP
jgi:hypothetical protein